MPILDRITTGGGDKGQTSLVDGSRVAKCSARVCAYGTVDELNSVVGLIRCEELPDGLFEKICRIQNQLFDLGSELATPPAAKAKIDGWGLGDQQIKQLEDWLQESNKNIQPAKSFILPGGSKASALFHLARTVTRRTEREVVKLQQTEAVEPRCLLYLNRLSDLFFVWARLCNDEGRDDLLWKRQS
ncbi:cob(I)yrinic acid a,c-diamide adenosyltransferase [Geopsychrobacter electrodiphilus]|uniref:cob(I)yrinic acid a,c-diamide adenosyltransferase n=1 Tax=Geopsychrobacter electrodiphilus TaxID=225196 RepID=UPI00035FBCBA|nr:cob(I)yrinic acid a,c-diamide adenosyltransferase [Geopsychrobacter electrodiphilus]